VPDGFIVRLIRGTRAPQAEVSDALCDSRYATRTSTRATIGVDHREHASQTPAGAPLKAVASAPHPRF
jgi:hypothetical protein